MSTTDMHTPDSRILRRDQRRLHCGYRDLSIAYEGSTREIPIRLPDLSTSGMFINTSEYFPEGAVLNIRFWLVRSNQEVNARAEVRYCLRGVGLGVQFVDLAPEARKAIEDELDSAARR